MPQKFTDMFKNLNQNNIEEAASNLLNEFMDKNLLLEPFNKPKSIINSILKKKKERSQRPISNASKKNIKL